METEIAVFAGVFLRRWVVRLYLEGGEDFCEEEPCSQSWVDEGGVFTNEAESGALGEVSFENGTGVGVSDGFAVGAGVDLAEVVGELFEGGAQGFVVVREAGVAGDVRGNGVRRRCGCVIVFGEADDGFYTGKDVFGVLSAQKVAFGGDPAHSGVVAVLDPADVVGIGCRRFGGGKFAVVEAELECFLADVFARSVR